MATNWATNIAFHDSLTLHPESIEELSEILRTHDSVKVRGTGHCFNHIADSHGTVVILDRMPSVLSIDSDAAVATAGAGLTYSQVATFLHENGWALPNLASLPHISLAGAITTGTHGSGIKNGALHTAIRAMKIMNADGSVSQISREKSPDFYAALVGLGRTGIVLSYEIDIVPTFDLYQVVYGDLAHETFINDLIPLMSSAYSVSYFTTWSKAQIGDLWVKSLELPPHQLHGSQIRGEKSHPIPGVDPLNCTEQGGVPGPWHLRLPHFRIDATPSAGNEQQSEFFVASSDAVAAFKAISAIAPQFSEYLLVSEIRAIAADEHWLSPAYQRETIAFHFTWKNLDTIPVVAALIEKVLTPFNYRPHFGKVFTAGSTYLESVLPKFGDFSDYVALKDPEQVFANEFTNSILL